ncbi:TPA: hypothetical protein GE369_23855 [Escherichia coli]|nr:hypothetical protein [Escherichia coli]HAG9280947.1 hypothetical protein [Escherichia coli]HAH0417109.1 hypothetical protein [Escherichia coli]HAH4128800.1 hypothetical protein [Escherichia coli]HAH4179288.1 hypothetical protein [Escherichia coli]
MYRVVCCRFYLTAAPFVANLSGAVRATGVMVNGFLCGLFHCAFRAPLPPPLKPPKNPIQHSEHNDYIRAH